MSKVFDLKGKQFGRLTVLYEGAAAKSGEKTWVCKCSCGTITKPIKSTRLRQGITQSCGCLQREIVAKSKTIHQQSRSRLYRVWRGMKDRCYRTSAINYAYYGGRGITVCDEWKNDFQAFRNWAISHGYSDDLTIDRIDNDKGYAPDNCRWLTMKEQNNNRRNTKRS